MTGDPRTLDADPEPEDEDDEDGDAGDDDPRVETLLLCSCGMTSASMDHYIDHVSRDHDALDVAVNALLEGEVEVELDD